MRTRWILWSATMLMLGSLLLAAGVTVSPVPDHLPLAEATEIGAKSPGRWLLSASLMFVASIVLTLGAVTVLVLLRGRQRLAVVATTLFACGTVGMTGYAALLFFLRGVVVEDLLVPGGMERIEQDGGLAIFSAGWSLCFIGGLTAAAVGMWLDRSTPRWVPVALIVFVLSQFVPLPGGYAATLIQYGLLAVALVGAGRAAQEYAHKRDVDAVLHQMPHEHL